MSDKIVYLSEDFWSIRGQFRIFGLLNIGTQASLLRRKNGRYLMLDAYTLEGDVKEQVDAITDGGADLEAIINLHPFHTVHVEAAHRQYPNARLYGTQRHHDRFPDLPWADALTESAECAALFAEDLEFSIPAGVDFISDNDKLHFASVLAYHPASKTIHSDDTLMYLNLPGPLGWLKSPEITFHMTLARTLEKRPGAARDFRLWARQLCKDWDDAENLCAAHSEIWRQDDHPDKSLPQQILNALKKVRSTLEAHEKTYD